MIYSNKVVVLENGKIKYIGTPKELLKLDWFYEMGFDMPQILKLSYELKKRGIDIDGEIWTVDEMERFLCSLR